MQECFIKTPLGIAQIKGDSKGISMVSILSSEKHTSKIIPKPLQECVNQLQEYFEGTRKEFNLKLNLIGTEFQKKIWTLLLKISFGKTISYLELSKRYGNVKAIRAVANAIGKNPLLIIIPCHRIIGSDGSLTGYAGGLLRKEWLINHENSNTQQSLF